MMRVRSEISTPGATVSADDRVIASVGSTHSGIRRTSQSSAQTSAIEAASVRVIVISVVDAIAEQTRPMSQRRVARATGPACRDAQVMQYAPPPFARICDSGADGD